MTTSKGKENQAIIEILDILYEFDEEAYGVKTEFDGVILIYTKLNAKEALHILRKKPTSVIFKIVPLEECVETNLENIVKTGLKLAKKYISKNDTFIVDCIRRGRYVKSSVIVEKTLGAEVIKNIRARVSFKEPKYIIKVEVIGKLTGLSVLKPQDIIRRKGRGKTVK